MGIGISLDPERTFSPVLVPPTPSAPLPRRNAAPFPSPSHLSPEDGG